MKHVFNSSGHEIRLPNIIESHDAYIIDANGKRYLDLESGVWCLPLGHNHPAVNTALHRQLELISHTGFCYSNTVVDAAADAVLSIVGLDGGKCIFLSSGSEIIELARQICRHLTKQSTSLCLHDGYFGSYSATNDREQGWHVFDWRSCVACPHNTNCKSDCPQITAIPEDISDFCFEPGSASGFVRFPPVSLIKNLCAATRKRGGKVLANEVTTGMGRTGAWFGYEHYEIVPDLVCIGKGIGNGYPVSVVALDESIASELADSEFKYMQSHQNDPLAAAVVEVVISRLVAEGLIERAGQLGNDFLVALQTLADSPHIAEIRSRGMMFAVEFQEDRVGDRVYDELLSRGYVVCNRGGMFRIDPPLNINTKDFLEFVDEFGQVLNAVT